MFQPPSTIFLNLISNSRMFSKSFIFLSFIELIYVLFNLSVYIFTNFGLDLHTYSSVHLFTYIFHCMPLCLPAPRRLVVYSRSEDCGRRCSSAEMSSCHTSSLHCYLENRHLKHPSHFPFLCSLPTQLNNILLFLYCTIFIHH